MNGKERAKWKRVAWLFGITAAVYLAFRYLLPLVWPFVFALLAAGLLRPVVRFLHRRLHVPIGIGSFVCAVLLFALFGVGGYFLFRLLLRQIGQLVQNLDTYLVQLQRGMERVCCMMDETLSLQDGTVLRTITDGFRGFGEHLLPGLFSGVREHTWDVLAVMAETVTFLFVFLIATVLILREMPEEAEHGENKRDSWQMLIGVKEKLSQIGLAYLKTQGILILIIAGILTVGLMLLKNRYALLIGLGIACMDAFPVLGSGMILIPWGVIVFFFGSRWHGILLLVLYLICQVTRELLEPRLLGNRIGIRPIYTLLSMYVGLRLFGVPGFLLGPLGLVVIRALADAVPEEWR